TMHGQPSASEMVVMGDAYTMHGQPSASEMVVMEDAYTMHGQVTSTTGQSTRSSYEGFMLTPDLAIELGMQPGARLFRSMFYGTPQSDVVLELVSQLSEMRENLLISQTLEIASATQKGISVDYENTAALIAANEELMQALMGSIESPSFTVLPGVAVEVVDTTLRQVPSAPGQSTIDHDEGFMLTPDLAIELGMQPGQVLRRSMFYGTSQSNIVLKIVSQLSAIREDLLHNQELEISGAIQDETSIGCENIAALMATNEELIRALVGSIEAPSVVVPTIAVGEQKTESNKKLLTKFEEEKNKRLEKSRIRLEMEAQEKREKLKKRYDAEEAKRREKEIEVDLGIARHREAELKRVKEKVKKIIEGIEITGSLSSRKQALEKELRAIKTTERELRRVLVKPISENQQEMEKKLEKSRARYKELKEAGAGKIAMEIDYLKSRKITVERELGKVIESKIKVKELEQYLKILVSNELDLEKRGAREEEIDRVTMREMRIETRLAELRAIVVNEKNLELELNDLIAKITNIEQSIDMGKRKIEIDRLKNESGAEAGERELELKLRLEGVNTKVRVLELKLWLRLGKLIAKKIEIERKITYLALEITEIIRKAREEEITRVANLTLGESEGAKAKRKSDKVVAFEVSTEVVAMQESEEEEGTNDNNTENKNDKK
ncbi:hypothetical protein, partial [Candidatus Ichthyocystis sparus]